MQNTHLRSIPAHFGESRVHRGFVPTAPAGELVKQQITYRNNLHVPVSVGWRNGLSCTLPASPKLERAAFVVCVSLSFQGERIVREFEAALARLSGEHPSQELKNIQEAFSLQLKENIYQGGTIVLEYPLSLDELKRCGGTLYYHELDIVVSLFPAEQMAAHPYSEEGRRNQVVAGLPARQGGAGFGYSVQIVDNRGLYGDRYLNIAGNVYKVTPVRDFALRDGVYIRSNYAANGELQLGEEKVTHVAMEAAQEELGLFRTYEEAANLGDMSQARKAELIHLEHEVQRQKMENQQIKQTHERELLERTHEIKRIDQELARQVARNQLLEQDLNIERQRMKDHFEERAYRRKDSSEALKILPSIIVGIGTLILALKALLVPAAATAAKAAFV